MPKKKGIMSISFDNPAFKDLEKIKDEIGNADAGLNHFAERKRMAESLLWETIYDFWPELKNWAIQVDWREKKIIKLNQREEPTP